MKFFNDMLTVKITRSFCHSFFYFGKKDKRIVYKTYAIPFVQLFFLLQSYEKRIYFNLNNIKNTRFTLNTSRIESFYNLWNFFSDFFYCQC